MLGDFLSVRTVMGTADFKDGEYSLCRHLDETTWKPEDTVYLIQDTYQDRSPAGQEILCVECGKAHDKAEREELGWEDEEDHEEYDDDDDDLAT